MEYELTWGGDAEDLLIRTVGTATVPEMNAMVEAVMTDEHFHSGLKVLVDHREATFTGFTTEHLRKRADQAAWQLRQGKPSKVAIVVGRDIFVVAGRLLESFIRARTSIAFRTFRTVEDARAWIAS